MTERIAWRANPALWVFVGIIGLTGVATIVQQGVYRQISPPGWGLAWSLALVYALPVFLVVRTLDLFQRQSALVVAGAIAWGATAATTLAALGNAGWGLALARVSGPDFAAHWVAAVTAPWVEESLKVVGVVFLYLISRDQIDDLMDGYVYGAMVGLGFAVVEDVFYFMGVFGGSPAAVLEGFFVRVVAGGFYGHLLYSGFAGIGVAYFVTRRGHRRRARRLLLAGGFVALGAFLHFLWNSPWLDLFPRRPWSGMDLLVLPVAVLVKAVPFLLFVLIAVILARRRERRWFDAVSKGSAADGILPRELPSLHSPMARRRAVRAMRRRAGPRAAALLRRLQREQILLAMLCARTAGADPEELADRVDGCRSLRDALETIPAAAPAAG